MTRQEAALMPLLIPLMRCHCLFAATIDAATDAIMRLLLRRHADIYCLMPHAVAATPLATLIRH